MSHPRARSGAPAPGIARRVRFLVAVVGGIILSVTSGRAEGPGEIYSFTTLGLGEDSFGNSFIDLHPGDDLLPYTDDDIELPEFGNIGGTWGASHIDSNSDGMIGEDEFIFTVTRRCDDDMFTFSAFSQPHLGVIYESEDWVDYHEARNRGPWQVNPADIDSSGDDFEHNDRPNWEDESNAYLYNSFQANQHGRGKSLYYFDHVNSGSEGAEDEPWVYDEIEGFRKLLNFQSNLQDDNGLDLKGPCRKDYMRTDHAITRGYLIPVEDLEGLEDGSLPTLFGWESAEVDLASYLRDRILPLLESEGLNWFNQLVPEPDRCDAQALGPVTHIMLLQIQSRLPVGELVDCELERAQELAAHWGIELDETSTYRVSHILGANMSRLDLMHGAAENYREWIDRPEPGQERNLWLLDHYVRDEPEHIGRYELVPADSTWVIEPDPNVIIFEQTENGILRGEGTASLIAPLPRPLTSEELPFELVVELNAAEAERVVHLSLLAGDDVKVTATLSDALTRLTRGGRILPSGELEEGEGVSGQGTPLDEIGGYTRFIVRVDRKGITLLRAEIEDVVPNVYDDIFQEDLSTELLFLEVEDAASLVGIDGVALSIDGPTIFSSLALLAHPPAATPTLAGLRRPGDANSDGATDTSDVVLHLSHLFLGERLPCGSGTLEEPANLALMDANDDDLADIADAVYLLSHFFLGGSAHVLGAECTPFSGCEAACPDAP